MLRTILILVLTAAGLSAQSITGTIVGTVTDSSGAVVLGAKVNVTSEGSGAAFNTTTNSNGDYTVPNLLAGEYRVQVSQAGFRPVDVKNVTVLLNQTVRADVRLEPGSLDQRVSVTAEAPLVQSETSSISSIIDTHAVQSLPVNGRTTATFILIAPGNASDWASNPNIGGAQHWGGSKFTVDGVSTDDLGNGGGTYSYATSLATQPSLETIDEMKIESNSAKAEYSGSVAVSTITKRGSNTVHGSLFEFNRNAQLAANQFFSNAAGKARPPYNRNEFGGSVGGPVIKNRTFFFGAVEALTLRQSNVGTFSVPVQSLRDGTFTTAVKDPLNSGAAFPNNQIPANRIDPRSKTMLGFIPLPTKAGATYNFVENLPVQIGVQRYSARVDHNFNQSNMLGISLAYAKGDPYSTNLYSPSMYGNYSNAGFLTKSASLTYTRILSANMTNELRGSYFTMVNIRIGQNQDFNPASIFPGLFTPIPMGGLPTFNISGYTKVGDVGGAQPNPQITNQVGDTFSWIHGSHVTKAGVDASFGRVSTNPSVSASVLGSFSFLARYTGNVIGDLLLGYPTSATRATATPPNVMNQNRYGFYIQDDWKVTRNLTVNAGLRYELQTQFTERGGALSNFDFGSGQMVVRTTGGGQYAPAAIAALLAAYPSVKSENVGWGSDLLLPDHKNFAPRVGLAYRPFGNNKTVVRGGYGIFYNLIPVYQGIYQLGISNTPYRLAQSFTGGATSPTISLADPFSVTPTVSANPVAYAVSRQIRNPYSQQWNLSVERVLPGEVGLRVAYLGNKGNRVLFVNSDMNLPATMSLGNLQTQRPYQPWANIYTMSPTGNMFTHQMQVEGTRRFNNGLFLQSSFNWTKTLDNVPYSGTVQNPYNTSLDRGNSEGIRRFTFYATGTYDLPFGTGKKFANWDNPMKYVVSGWRLASVVQLRSGAPFSVTFTPTLGGWYANRADVAGSDFYGSNQSIARWFNPSAFAVPANFTFGNSARNMLFGPGSKSIDASLTKITAITERIKTEFRAEFFNVPNTPSFGLPAADITVPSTVGIISSTTVDARTIQFGLKLLF